MESQPPIAINWPEYQAWHLVRFYTPGDGHCLLHSLSAAYFKKYKEAPPPKRVELVENLRTELAVRLGSVAPLDFANQKRAIAAVVKERRIARDYGEEEAKYEVTMPYTEKSSRYYDLLVGGNIQTFGKSVVEFSLKVMQDTLRSNSSLGYGYLEFIGDALNKDIYILEENLIPGRQGVYVTDETPFMLRGREAIIVWYSEQTLTERGVMQHGGHYELVGMETKDRYYTCFSPNHPLIRFLCRQINGIGLSHRIQTSRLVKETS